MSVAYDRQFVFQISHTWSKPDFVTHRLVKFSFFSFRCLILKLINFRLSQFSPVYFNRYSKHLESNYWANQPSVDIKNESYSLKNESYSMTENRKNRKVRNFEELLKISDWESFSFSLVTVQVWLSKPVAFCWRIWNFSRILPISIWNLQNFFSKFLFTFSTWFFYFSRFTFIFWYTYEYFQQQIRIEFIKSDKYPSEISFI